MERAALFVVSMLVLVAIPFVFNWIFRRFRFFKERPVLAAFLAIAPYWVLGLFILDIDDIDDAWITAAIALVAGVIAGLPFVVLWAIVWRKRRHGKQISLLGSSAAIAASISLLFVSLSFDTLSPSAPPEISIGAGPRGSGGGGGSGPRIHTSIPHFPWPPPAASAFSRIPIKQFLTRVRPARTSFTMGDAEGILMSSLENAGYLETSFFLVPRGFALVTRLEQIESDGKPMPEEIRWQATSRQRVFSLEKYFQALFLAPPGYYRVIVFVITPEAFAQDSRAVGRDEAMQWLRSGAVVLPEEIREMPFAPDTNCTALIYEFEKRDIDDEPQNPVPGRLGAASHLAILKLSLR